MACVITQGFNLDCRDNKGGVKSVYLTEYANVTASTEAAGVITAITKASAKRFWKINVPKQVAELNQDMTASETEGTQFVNQKVSFVLHKLTATMREEIFLWISNKLLVVVEDWNGKYWMMGKDGGAYCNTASANTGKEFGNMNGFTLNIEAFESKFAPEVTSVIALALETPGT
jgi:hypothetical protein